MELITVGHSGQHATVLMKGTDNADLLKWAETSKSGGYPPEISVHLCPAGSPRTSVSQGAIHGLEVSLEDDHETVRSMHEDLSLGALPCGLGCEASAALLSACLLRCYTHKLHGRTSWQASQETGVSDTVGCARGTGLPVPLQGTTTTRVQLYQRKIFLRIRPARHVWPWANFAIAATYPRGRRSAGRTNPVAAAARVQAAAAATVTHWIHRTPATLSRKGIV